MQAVGRACEERLRKTVYSLIKMDFDTRKKKFGGTKIYCKIQFPQYRKTFKSEVKNVCTKCVKGFDWIKVAQFRIY
jgi:hypothetical protein